jgi:hypothetical protein
MFLSASPYRSVACRGAEYGSDGSSSGHAQKPPKKILVVPDVKEYAGKPSGEPMPIFKPIFVLNTTAPKVMKQEKVHVPKYKEAPVYDYTTKPIYEHGGPVKPIFVLNTTAPKVMKQEKVHVPKYEEAPVYDYTTKPIYEHGGPVKPIFVLNATAPKVMKQEKVRVPKYEEAPVEDITEKYDDLYKVGGEGSWGVADWTLLVPM